MRFKKMNKKIFTLLLLVFVLISMSAVSSADLNDTDTALAVSDSSDIVAAPANNNSDVLGINENQDTLQVPDSDDILGAEPLDVDDWKKPNPTMNQGESNPTWIIFYGEFDGDYKSGVPVKLTVDKDYRATTGSDGKATFDLSEVAPGTYTGQYRVEGSDYSWDYYAQYSFPLTVVGDTPSKTTVYLENVNGVASIEMNEGDDETFTAGVYADSMGANPMEGLNLKLTAGSNTLNAVSDANGEATFDLSTVTHGTYTASIGVDSDTYEEDTPLTFALTVTGQKTSVHISDSRGVPAIIMTEGEHETYYVIVEDMDYNYPISGVRVKLTAGDNVVYATSDSDGEATLDLSTVTAGNYNAVTVVDDDNYESSDSVPLTLTVNENAKTSVVISDYPGSVEITEGDAGNFYVFVYDNLQDANPVSGVNVKLTAGTTVVSAVSDSMGQASFDLSSVPAGTYTPSVVVDDANYKSNTVTFDLTVNPGTKTNVNLVNINQLTEIIMYEGENPICDFQVLDSDTMEVDGVNVKLTAGSTELNVTSQNGGLASFDLSTVPVGDYTASVVVDDDDYKSNTVTFHLVVNSKAESYLSADRFADGLTINVGDHVLLNATLEDFITGISGATVVFLLNDTEYTNVTDENGKATFDLSGIPVGEYLVNYRFDGNDQYKASNLTVNDQLTVSKIATEIEVTNSTLDLNVNDEVDSGATLTPADAGALTYSSSNETVAVVVDGKIQALAAGETTITVSFAGNENYTAADDKTIEVTVSKIATEITVENATLSLNVNDEVDSGATLTPADAGALTYSSSNETVAVVVNGKIQALAAGTAVITVSFAGNDTYAAAEDKTIEVTVSKIATTITVNQDSFDLKVNDQVDSGATLTPADAGNLTYTSSNETVAVVVDGKINALAAGTTNITVSFAGNENYTAAESKTIEVTVSLIQAYWYYVLPSMAPELDGAEISLNVGDSFPPCYAEDDNGNYLPNGQPVKVQFNETCIIDTTVYDNVGSFSVDISGVNPGTYTVTFSSPGYTTATATVTISKIATEITVENATLSLNVNDEVDSGATLTPADAGNLTYTSSNETVAVVVNGKIQALAVGTAVITVSFAGDDTYAAADNKTIIVNVGLNDASVSVNNETLDLKVDDNFTIVATTVPENLNVTYTSSNESVATVDAQGNVEAVGAGTATITVSVGGDGVYALNTTEVAVTVTLNDASVIADNMELKVGENGNISYLTDPDDLNVTFVPDDSGVVNVTADGTVTALKEGTAQITVKVGGDGVYAENSTVITVTVTLNDASVIADNMELKVGENGNISYLTDPDDLNVTFVPDDSGVVNVTADGTVTALKEGTAQITVKVGGDGVYAENSTVITVTVTLNDASVSAENMELKIGENGNINYTTSPSGLNVSFVPDDSGIVDVSDNGTVTALKEGVANVTVLVGDGKKYALNSTVITVTVTLNDAKWTYLDFIWGEEHKLDGATLMLPWNYSPTCFVKDANKTGLPAGTNITIFCQGDENYTINSVVQDDGQFSVDISDIALGKYKVTFSAGDAYTTATATVTIIKGLTEITVENETVSLKVGEEVGSGATLTPADAGNLTYTSSNESVAVVVDGKIKAIAAGTANITVSFAENDRYYAATNKTITVTVTLNDASVTVNNETLDLKVGDTFTIVPTTVPEGLNVTYVPDESGVYSVDDNGVVTALKNGTGSIIVKVGGDGVYAENSTTVTVTVSKIPTEIIVQNNTWYMEVGDISEGNATLTPADAGNLTYTSMSPSVIKVENGKLVAVAEGKANVVVTFNGNDKYSQAESVFITVMVSKVPTEINITNATVDMEVNDEVATGAALTPADAGNVTYAVSNSSVVKVEDGKIVALAEGSAVITVSFNGTDKYAAAEDKTIEVTVNLKDASVSVNNESVDLNVDDTFTIVPTTVPEGLNVTYVPDESGVYSVDDNGVVTALKNGTGSIIVKVGGDGVYAENTTTVTVTVSKVPTEISIENATVDMEVTDEVATGAALTPADAGNVTYAVSNSSVVKVEDGKIVALAEGSAVITVSFNGTDKYAAAEDKTIEVTVNLKDASVSVNNETVDLNVDDTFTIVPTTVPEGLNVTYVPDESGVYSVDDNGVVTALKNGTGSIIVKVGGDGVYAENTTTVTVTVSKIPTEILIQNKTLDMVIDDIADPVVSLMPSNAGNLSFKVSDTSVILVNGHGNVMAVGEGTATVTVSFGGNDKYLPSNATITVTVSKIPTEISVDPASLDLVVGNESAIAATLTPADAGNVTFTSSDDSVVTVDDKGNVVAVGEGTATVTVSFAGDDKYAAAENVTVSVSVAPKPKENATISIDAPAEASEGDNVTVTVTLPEDATGTVTIGNEVVPVKNGTASAVLTNLPAGNTTVPITYSGDDKYNPIETGVNISVKEDTSIIISAPDVTKYFHGSERFVVNVTDSKGAPLVNKSVTIVINGVPYTRTTNANGTTSIPLGLNSGVYNVTVTVDNNTVNSVVTILPTVNGTDVVKMYRNGTQYFATFRDSQGNYLKAGETVRFNINGVMYDRKVSGNEGLAKLNINLEAGEYVITAMNPVTGEMASNNITVLSRFTENKDLTKYYRNASQYTVKVIGDDGKPVGAGETVRFNINGVFYERTTNASGVAKLNINLQPGDYIITAEYKGDMVSNNIKVLPVLSAKDITMKYRDGTQFKATLVDSQGKPYAGQTVTFNINGVFYNRVTGSDGIAKLNINLMPGEYIITSSYNGSNIANTVKITG